MRIKGAGLQSEAVVLSATLWRVLPAHKHTLEKENSETINNQNHAPFLAVLY